MTAIYERPRVFEFDSFHDYMNRAIVYASRQYSMRGLARSCGFNSPGYMQRIVKKRILPSSESLENISEGLRLDSDERRYLLLLAERQRVHSEEQRRRISEQLAYVKKKANHRSTSDKRLLASWVNFLILEMTMLPDFEPTVTYVESRLGTLANPAEIKDSLEFLVENNVLYQEQGRWQKSFATYERFDDQKVDSSRKLHARALTAAIGKLDESCDQREFQGLTIGVKREDMTFIKRKIRQTIDEIDLQLSRNTSADDVIQIEFAAFSTLRKQESKEDLL